MNKKLLGKRIQKYRVESGRTAEQFAEQIDLSTSMIREIERGNRLPSLGTLVKIANELNVSTDELLCDSVNKSSYIVSSEISQNLESLNAEDTSLVKNVIETLVAALLKRNQD